MNEPLPPSLTLLAAFDLLRNKNPAELTADEVAGLRARLQASPPALLAAVGGPAAVERFLAEAEAALETQAAVAARAAQETIKAKVVPRERGHMRRKLEMVLYAAAVIASAGGLYFFLRQGDQTAPATKQGERQAAENKTLAASQPTQATPDKPTPATTKKPSSAAPVDEKPLTETVAEDPNDPNLWLGWRVTRSKGGTADKKYEWDRTDVSNPVPGNALTVSGGPLRLTRSMAIGAEDKWLLVLARPATAVFPAGQITVSIDGKQVAQASIGTGESDWPLYVPLTDSQQVTRQFELVFTPGTPGQQIVFWNARLVAKQGAKPQPESPLIAALRSDDPAVRVQGATAAGQVHDPLVVGALVRALKDSNRDVRRAAVLALAKYNTSPPFVVEALIEKLRDADPEIPRLTAQTLMAFDAESTWVALSKAMTEHPDLQLRSQIAGQLSGRPQPDVRAAFAKLLDSPEDPLRLAAVNSLANSADPAGAALLLRALGDKNRDVRRAALAILPRYNAAAPAVVIEALIGQLRGTDTEFRRLAAQTLMSFDTDSTWVALAQTMSSHADPQLRLQIAGQLAGRKHPAIRAAVEKLLDDVDDPLRLAAVTSLANNPDPATVPLLVRAMADPEPGVRRIAATALATRNDEAAEAAMITALASHPDAQVRRTAITRFHKIPTVKALPAIRSAMAGPDNLLRRLVPPAVAKLPGDEVDAMLVQLYNSPDYNIRFMTVAEGFANRPGQVAEDIMLKAVSGENVSFQQFGLRRFTQPALVTPRVIPALREALKSPSGMVRFEVVGAILGVRRAQMQRSNLNALSAPPWNETLDLMVQMIDDPVPRVRAGAAGVLRGDPHPDADAIMPRLLKSQDVLVRQLAAGRYPSYSKTSVKNIEFHRECLKDSNPVVRACAVAALVTIRSPESAKMLAAAFDDADVSVRVIVQTARLRNPAAVQDDALLPTEAKTGMASAVPVLVKLLSDPKPSVRKSATQWLCQNLDPAADQAIQQACTSHSDLTVRRLAAQYLRKPETPGGIEIVRGLIRDPDPELRETAIHLLLRTPTPEKIAIVAPLLADPVASVRMTAATLLCVTPLPAADDVVIPLLSNPDWQIRQMAVQRFTRTPNPRAANGLAEAAAAPEFEIRLEAMRALSLLKEPAVFALLAHNLNDPSELTSGIAAEMLRGRSEPETVAPMLAALASHPRIGVRAIAATKFEAQPNPAALGPLLVAAKHEDDGLRAVAIRALGKCNDPAATTALVAALGDPVPEVKMAAATLLVARRDDAAEAAMISALATHADVEIRRLAATRFQQVPTPKAVPALAEAMKNPDDQLRLLSAQALQTTPAEAIDLLIAALDDPSENVRQTALGVLTPHPDPRAKAAVAAFKARMQPVP